MEITLQTLRGEKSTLDGGPPIRRLYLSVCESVVRFSGKSVVRVFWTKGKRGKGSLLEKE